MKSGFLIPYLPSLFKVVFQNGNLGLKFNLKKSNVGQVFGPKSVDYSIIYDSEN